MRNKYPYIYEGQITIQDFFYFIKANTTIKCEPMNETDISTLISKVSPRILPKAYIDFLRNAGQDFGMWDGDDYKQIFHKKDGTLTFLDIKKDILDDKQLKENFYKFGFDIDDCFFFKSHATESINFFRFGDGDDPKVYYLDSNSTDILSLKRHTFTECIIGQYNYMVKIQDKLDNPYTVYKERFVNNITSEWESKFSFSVKEHRFVPPGSYDVYTYQSPADAPYSDDLYKLFVNAMANSVTDIPNVLMFTNGVFYNYCIERDKNRYNSLQISPLQDFTIIVGWDSSWGWISNYGDIFVWGEKFKKEISAISAKLKIYKKENI